MFALIHSSLYTEYTAGQYPTLALCIEDCVERYGLKNRVFGQDDNGTLYTVVYADGEGCITLKVIEMDT